MLSAAIMGIVDWTHKVAFLGNANMYLDTVLKI